MREEMLVCDVDTGFRMISTMAQCAWRSKSSTVISAPGNSSRRRAAVNLLVVALVERLGLAEGHADDQLAAEHHLQVRHRDLEAGIGDMLNAFEAGHHIRLRLMESRLWRGQVAKLEPHLVGQALQFGLPVIIQPGDALEATEMAGGVDKLAHAHADIDQAVAGAEPIPDRRPALVILAAYAVLVELTPGGTPCGTG